VASDAGEASVASPEVLEADRSEAVEAPDLSPVLRAIAELDLKVDHLAGRDERENRMYDDLRRLREADDIVRSLPLFRSVIQVIDRVRALQNGRHDLITALPEIEEELVELLERYGIEQISRPSGARFDASLQKAIGHLAPESDQEVEVVGAGYVYREQVIRHEQVLVRAQISAGDEPTDGER
jgi:molecular chaperone GrpE (heat shock protein)